MGRKDKSGMTSGSTTSYREYSNISDANAALGFGNGGETDEWTKGLSAEEKKALNNYSIKGYMKINDTLRKLKEGKDIDPESSVGKRINAIEGAIDRYDLTEPTIFTRQSGEDGLLGLVSKEVYNKYMSPKTTNKEREDMLNNIVNSMVGSVIHDKGFTSTSASSDMKSSMGKGGMLNEVRYRIKTPKGKGIGAYIAGASHFKDTESEFLFNRGSAFKVTGMRQQRETVYNKFLPSGSTERTVYYIDMEYVGRY